MPMRFLLSVVFGAVLVLAWGGFAWAGGLYKRFMLPMPGGDAVVQVIDSAAPRSGMYVHPPEADLERAGTLTDVEREQKARQDKFRKGPVIMMALTKGPQDLDDPRMFVRGFLIEFFATAMLVSAIGLAGSAHGRLRRFLALQAMVVFMVLATHMIFWAFMFAPNDWTAVLVFDSWFGWTLAGLPAVFLMRAMREGDTSAA
ncbi:MAG: hypothetical protein FJ292_06445 [Planctomycetes bacterium]|nr:hypothetical protein [Planctomycetota bacterium]